MNFDIKEILLVPHSSLLESRIFDCKKQPYDTTYPWKVLRDRFRSLGFDVKTIDQSKDIRSAYAIIFFEMPRNNNQSYLYCLKNGLQNKMYLLAMEPSAVHPPNHDPKAHSHFRRVLTWDDELVDNKKYFKINFSIPIHFEEKIIIPRTAFNTKKLLCMVSSNKYSSHPRELYSERIRAIRFMEQNHSKEFDLYGVGWDYPVMHNGFANDTLINAAILKFWPKLPRIFRLKQFSSYRGTIKSKGDYLPKYKFAICYENEIGARGYISEKILDSLRYGCVPVYLGDPNICDRIPKDCFIDKRDYSTYESLYERIACIGEEEHKTYLNKIERFLNSEKIYPFTIDAFINSFEKLLDV